MIVVSSDYNYYLTVTNDGTFSNSWIKLLNNYGDIPNVRFTYFMIKNREKPWTDIFNMDNNNNQCINCGLRFDKFPNQKENNNYNYYII